MEIPWARDSWRGIDKLAHNTASFQLTALLGLVFIEPAAAVLAFLAGIAWEFVEWFRYEGWEATGIQGPRPAVCDLPSYKDVVWNVIGIVLAVWLF